MPTYLVITTFFSPWADEFKRGRYSTEDEPRLGRPKTSTTDKQVDVIHRMVGDDRRKIVQHIAKNTGISACSLHSKVDFTNGDTRTKAVQVNLYPFSVWSRHIYKRLVTQCETRVYYFKPESKTQATEMLFGIHPLKNSSKLRASVFCDSDVVFMIDYLEKG